LPPFTFATLFPVEKKACGPGARALRTKSIGGKRIRKGDPLVLPQGEAGLSGATEFGIRNVEFGIYTSFFPFRIPQSAFRIQIARPPQKMRRASWFLRVRPLLPGRATPEIQSIFRLFAEK
jgi:hypothetical protein